VHVCVWGEFTKEKSCRFDQAPFSDFSLPLSFSERLDDDKKK
jgi:hypothetical protein